MRINPLTGKYFDDMNPDKHDPVPTMSDLWDTISRIERKIDMLGKKAGAFTTLEGVTADEKNSLKGGGE